MQELEEQIAHLIKTVEELNAIVVQQQTDIDLLTRKVEFLMLREAERAQENPGGVVIGDERPPHY